MRRFLVLFALIVLAPVALVACSDDGDDGADDAATDGTTDDGDDASDGDASDGDGDASGDIEAFCEQVVAIDAAENPSDEEAVEALNQLVEEAPDEIRDDLETVAAVLEDIGEFDEDDPEAFAEVLGLMDDEEFVEAAENLEAFGVEECGIEPTDDTLSTVPTLSVPAEGD